MFTNKLLKTYEDSVKSLNYEKEKVYTKANDMFVIFMAVEVVKTITLIVIAKKIH